MKMQGVFALLALMAGAVQAEQIIYVNANAEKGGDGSQTKPVCSLEEARNQLRLLWKNKTFSKELPSKVIFAPGKYPILKTVEFIQTDGGTAKAPIRYCAEKKGEVLFYGGYELKGNQFTKLNDQEVLSKLSPGVRGKIFVYDLSNLIKNKIPSFPKSFNGSPAAPWLFADGEMTTLARWPNPDAPNKGWATFTKATDKGLPDPKATDPEKQKLHPGAFIFDDPRPAQWDIDQGVWLLGYWTHDWSSEVLRVKSYDPGKKEIALGATHGYGINGGTWGASKRRFFAMNTLSELDAPDEWYLDREKKLLYFYPKNDLAKSKVILATNTGIMLKVSNAYHISFENLRFEYNHGNLINLDNTTHVKLLGCQIANGCQNGISAHGKNNEIRSCEVFNLGRSGISIGGGDRKELIRGNNLVANNHIHHYGIFQRTYAPGIGIRGCGQIVRNNKIHDAPHNAILYGGNEHLLELNEVYRVVMETGDAGAFYTGRDWTSQGNILRYNYFHHLGGGDDKHVNTMGIYLDDCDCGDRLEGNVFWKAGRAILVGGGRDNPVVNNLIIDCPIAIHMDSRGMTSKQWNNPKHPSWMLETKAKRLNYKQLPWSERYPGLAKIMDDCPREPLYNPILHNIVIDSSKQVCSFDGNVKKLMHKMTIEDNLCIATTGTNTCKLAAKDQKGFKNLVGTQEAPIRTGIDTSDPKALKISDPLALKKLEPMFRPIPFDKIGLYLDDYRTSK